jgi:hypothetical protein
MYDDEYDFEENSDVFNDYEQGEDYEDFDVDNGEEGNKYKPEVDFYNRIGLPGLGNLIQDVAFTGKFGDDQSRINKVVQNPKDRFSIYIDAISRSLRNIDNVTISEANIITMIEKVYLVDNIEYKNPTSYVLGFLASGGGNNLNTKNFNNTVKNILPHVTDHTIKQTDVLRYARYWVILANM